MFGDPFGQRSDYSRGVFYGHHRKYLTPPGKTNLVPPPEFMTKKQSKHLRSNGFLIDNSEEKKSFNVNFANKKDDEPGPSKGKLKKMANLVKRATILSNEGNHINPDDWVETFEAGVKLWINKTNGDVHTEKPWMDEPVRSRSSSRQFSPSVDKRRTRTSSGAGVAIIAVSRPEEDDGFGTGSLVYDSTEIQDLFKMLDSVKKR